MLNSDKKKVVLWLLSGCILIFLMVVIGGITRLTGSGLSITEWNGLRLAAVRFSEKDFSF